MTAPSYMLRRLSAEKLIEQIRLLKRVRSAPEMRDPRLIDRGLIDLYLALGCSRAVAELWAVAP